MQRWGAAQVVLLLGIAACRSPATQVEPPQPPPPSPGRFIDAVAGPEPEATTQRIEPTQDPRASVPLSGSLDRTRTPLPPLPKTVAARVGRVEISMAQFHALYDLKQAKYRARGREMPATADRRYRRSIADRLIYQEVLRQEADKLGVQYDHKALAAEIARHKQGIRDWAKHLSRRGETDDSFRSILVAELREQAILERRGALKVTRAEVQAEYDEVKHSWHSDKPRIRASHILIVVGPSTPRRLGEPPPVYTDEEEKRFEAQARAKAKAVYDKAKQPGADFAALAREHGNGPTTRKGGDLGFFTRDRVDQPFADAAFALKVGEVSPPVKTKFGYHIIKLLGRYPPGELPLHALEPMLRERLHQRKLATGRRDLKRELQDRYEIEDYIAPTY